MAKSARNNKKTPQSNTSLVPLDHQANISEGIQAYRRGNQIIYTVRGEPEVIKELMSELDRNGVGQVVALISHPNSGEPNRPLAIKNGNRSDSGDPT